MTKKSSNKPKAKKIAKVKTVKKETKNTKE